MGDDLRVLIWEPSIYRDTLACYTCNENIPAKSLFFILEGEIKWLLPHDTSYQPYSTRCASCGLKYFMDGNFDGLFRNAIKNHNVTYEGIDTPLVRSIKQLVRDELQQILKEEAYDPNGPFSPAP